MNEQINCEQVQPAREFNSENIPASVIPSSCCKHSRFSHNSQRKCLLNESIPGSVILVDNDNDNFNDNNSDNDNNNNQQQQPARVFDSESIPASVIPLVLLTLKIFSQQSAKVFIK